MLAVHLPNSSLISLPQQIHFSPMAVIPPNACLAKLYIYILKAFVGTD